MRSFNYAALSSISALIIGILLVVWPGVAISYLVITIGVLFLLPGIYGLVSYFSLSSKKEETNNRVAFPIVALGSTLFGFWLMINPAFFVSILMYVLGALLVLGGLSEVMKLMALRAYSPVPVGVFLIPVMILAAGIVVLFNPFEAATVPFIILGVSGIIYGLTDLLRLMQFRRNMKKREAEVEDVTIIEEIKDVKEIDEIKD